MISSYNEVCLGTTTNTLDRVQCWTTYPVSAPKAVSKFAFQSKTSDQKKEEGNNPMNTKYYIEDRIYQIDNTLDNGLRKQFHLNDDPSPATAAEFVKRIQDGKFVLPPEKEDYGIRAMIWRDPAVVADKDGYKVARDQLNKARQNAFDTINVVSDEQVRLKALKDFEAWTPTVVTTTAQ